MRQQIGRMANDMSQVCTVAEAKAIYPLMGIAANVALVAAGNFMKAVTLALKVRSRQQACRLSTSSFEGP